MSIWGQNGGVFRGSRMLWGLMVLCLLTWVSVMGGHVGGDMIWNVKNGILNEMNMCDMGRSWADIVKAGTRHEPRRTKLDESNTTDGSAGGQVTVGPEFLAELGEGQMGQNYTSTSRSSQTGTTALRTDGQGGQVDRYVGSSPLA